MNTNYTNHRIAMRYERVIDHLSNHPSYLNALHSIENYPSKITSKNLGKVRKDLNIRGKAGVILEKILEGHSPHDVLAFLKDKSYKPVRRPQLRALILRMDGGYA